MSQAEIANKVNTLVEMLRDAGVEYDEIKDTLDLTSYEIAFFDLGWMYEEPLA